MARILAVTWDGGGNVPPLLGITTRLRERGHDVRVLGHATQREAVEAAGAAFVPYRHAGPWNATAPRSGPRWAAGLMRMMTETGPAQDVTGELPGVDLVVADCMRLSALRAAVRSPVPTVALMHSFRRYVAHDWARGPVGRIATLRGMRPATLWDACDRVLVATDRELDPDAGDTPRNVRWTGAVQPPPRSSRTGRPTVVVSLSTIFYPAQARILQTVLDGLADLDVHVAAATGPGIEPRSLRAGPDTEVHRHLPHDEVLPTASLLVGHGGHATTLRALAHGLPVLVVPLDPHLDHRMVGAAVETAGAGRVLRTDATPERIREAARALLADGPHRRAAASAARRIGTTDGAGAACDEIEAVLRRVPA